MGGEGGGLTLGDADDDPALGEGCGHCLQEKHALPRSACATNNSNVRLLRLRSIEHLLRELDRLVTHKDAGRPEHLPGLRDLKRLDRSQLINDRARNGHDLAHHLHIHHGLGIQLL